MLKKKNKCNQDSNTNPEEQITQLCRIKICEDDIMKPLRLFIMGPQVLLVQFPISSADGSKPYPSV